MPPPRGRPFRFPPGGQFGGAWRTNAAECSSCPITVNQIGHRRRRRRTLLPSTAVPLPDTPPHGSAAAGPAQRWLVDGRDRPEAARDRPLPRKGTQRSGDPRHRDPGTGPDRGCDGPDPRGDDQPRQPSAAARPSAASTPRVTNRVRLITVSRDRS
jgi:hypothetical protein